MAEAQKASGASQAKNPSKVDYRSREHRKPLTGLEQRLSAEVPDGLVGRWVNDTPGRLIRFIQAGWKFASRDEGVVREQDEAEGAIYEEHALTSERDESVRAYLMLIPEELYREDQAAKQGVLDAQMERIKRGGDTQMSASDHAYVPEDTPIKLPSRSKLNG